MARALAFAFLACVVLPRAVFAQAAGPVVMTAQQIALHADRGLLIADGGVAVHGTALQLTATRVAYDLRANTLTAVGDVAVGPTGAQQPGSAYVYDFNAKRGRFAPGATVAQLSNADALAIGRQVELRPAQTITFSNAQVLTGSTFAPVASYTYAIPPPAAKDFGYSPVPSAALEWALPLSATSNAYEFARVRYDRYNGGPGAGLEERYARTDRGYVAFGQTQDFDGSRFDLAAYQRCNAWLSQTLTSSLLAGTRTWRYALAAAGRFGYASLSSAQYNDTRSDDLFASGNQRPVGKVGSLRFQFDLGHDVHPGDAKVAQDFRVTPGVHADTAALRLGPASLTSSADVGEAVYDYGRGTLSSDVTFWGTLPDGARLLWNGGATFSHNAPPYPGTSRTYTLGASWHASDAFNLVTSLNYTHDYGQAPGAGRPEFTAAFDVRMKRKDGRGVEVGTLLPFGRVGNMQRQAVLNVRFIR